MYLCALLFLEKYPGWLIINQENQGKRQSSQKNNILLISIIRGISGKDKIREIRLAVIFSGCLS